MKSDRLIAAVCLAIVALLIAGGLAHADSWTITPNSLTAGSVTFTQTYPKVAARQARNPQFHENPVTYVFCDGGYAGITYVEDKWTVPGGFGATTYPLDLPAGNCTASVIYWTYDKDSGVLGHEVAWTQFTVGVAAP